MESSDEDMPLRALKKKKTKPKASAEKKKVKKRAAVPDRAPSSSSSASKKRKANGSGNGSSGSSTANKKAKGLKKLDKAERLQYAMQSFLWWDAEDPPEGCQWRTMDHAGVSFPEPYEPHGVKMLYDGEPVDLTPAEEEVATFFAGMDPDGKIS